MKREEPSNHVRLAATTALLNSLELKANFDKEVVGLSNVEQVTSNKIFSHVIPKSDRHFIMQAVCEGFLSVDTKVRVATLQCLVKIVSFYYQYMEHYMGPALFAVSLITLFTRFNNLLVSLLNLLCF